MILYLFNYLNVSVLTQNILRAVIAFILPFLLVICLTPLHVNYLKFKKIGEGIRDYIPAFKNEAKKQTASMGGLVIFFSVLLTAALVFNFNQRFTILLPAVTLLFLIIGFLDDYLKNFKKQSKGISPYIKLLIQVIVCFAVFVYMSNEPYKYSLALPFARGIVFNIPALLYLILIFFIISGSSNAVNLTDGMDGLAAINSIIVFIFFAVLAFIQNDIFISFFLKFNFISDSFEIALYLLAIIGALLAFLWYNSYPAQLIMGDTGSLTLGGIMGIVSILLKDELFLPIIGLFLIIETASVILQSFYWRIFKRRLFKMAPIHHHYELLGIHEAKFTARVLILSLFLFIISVVMIGIGRIF